MKEIVKFKEWNKFDFKVGNINEIQEKNVLVDVGFEDVIHCHKGILDFNIGDKVIVLLNDNEGRILMIDNNFLTVDKDIKEGSKIT